MQVQGKFMLMTIAEFSQWLLKTNVQRTITHIQSHHTWSPSYRNFNGMNHFEKLRGMEAAHMQRGWNEIGQNITTFPDGTLAICRSFEKTPACIKFANTGGICIENLGNFDGPDVMTEAQRNTIIKLNAWLCYKFELTPDLKHIVYHHWFKLSNGERDGGSNDPGYTDHKTCPGITFFGGNTEAACTQNFLPLIVQELVAIGQNMNIQLNKNGVVHVPVLNVRTGPGTGFPIVSKLKEHDVVTIIESNGEWDKIGNNQWVKSDYVALK